MNPLETLKLAQQLFDHLKALTTEIQATRLEMAELRSVLMHLDVTAERDGEEQTYKVTAEPIAPEDDKRNAPT